MTKKLLVIIALGASLAIVAAGTAISGTVSVGNAQVSVPGTQVLPQCSNLSDDDGDGLVDLGDPGCSSAVDTSEYNAPTTTTTGGGTTTSGGSGSATTTGSGTTTAGSGSSNSSGGKSGKAGQKTSGGKTPGIFGKQNKKGQGAKNIAKGEKQKIEHPTLRNPDGSPAATN